MVENLAITPQIIDGVEQRAAYRLAGLEVPDGTVYKFNSQTGESEILREPPKLPSVRALLAQLLEEGRNTRERPVQVASLTAVVELLLEQTPKGKGTT